MCVCWTTIEDGVGPGLGCDHSDGGIDIGNVDQEALEYDDVKPHILHAHSKAVVRELACIHEVELRGATLGLTDIAHKHDSVRTLWSGTISRFHVPPLRHISPQ